MNSKTIGGKEFSVVKRDFPIPHWCLKLPTGEVWDDGTAGINGESRPKLWASLDDLISRIGIERFMAEINADDDIDAQAKREVLDIVADDLPDGAYFAMAEEMGVDL